jgi:hypothetical protein
MSMAKCDHELVLLKLATCCPCPVSNLAPSTEIATPGVRKYRDATPVHLGVPTSSQPIKQHIG